MLKLSIPGNIYCGDSSVVKRIGDENGYRAEIVVPGALRAAIPWRWRLRTIRIVAAGTF